MKSTPIELACAFVLLLYAAWRGKSALATSRPSYLACLLSSITAITFGAGPFIAFIYGDFQLPAEPVPEVLTAYAAVAAFIIGCEIAGHLFRKNKWEDVRATVPNSGASPISGSILPPLRFLAVTEAILIFTRLYFGWEHGIFFSGSGTGARISQLSYSAVIVFQLAPMVGGACLLCAYFKLWAKPSHFSRAVALTIIVFEVAWMATQGRRSMIEAIVSGIMTFRFVKGRVTWRATTAFLGAAAVLWFVVFPAFLAVRVGLLTGANDSSTSSMPLAAPSYDPEVAKELHSTNAITRPLIIRFVVRISEDQRRIPVMYGGAIASSLYRSIPAAFIGEKADSQAPEKAIQDHYRQISMDASTTWPAVGMADFGLLGALLMGVLFASTLVLSCRICLAAGLASSFVYMAQLAFVIHCCVFVEECPSALWSGLRNVAILTAVFWFAALPSKHLLGARSLNTRNLARARTAHARPRTVEIVRSHAGS